jgi:hypothetical protein
MKHDFFALQHCAKKNPFVIILSSLSNAVAVHHKVKNQPLPAYVFTAV